MEVEPLNIIINACNSSQLCVINKVLIKSYTRVGTLLVATIYLQLIQNRHMFRSFTVLHLGIKWKSQGLKPL